MLLSLPTELIVGIFDKADSFTTAFALSHTCHRLRTIWKANANAILPSVVECFPQALDLTQTQDMYRSDEYGRIQEITRSRQEVPVLHSELMERNAVLVSRILPYYEHNIINAFSLRGIKRDTLDTNERTDLFRAIYRAMTLAAAGKQGCTSPSLLAPLHIREYKQMRGAMEFLQAWFDSDQKASLTPYNPSFMKDFHLYGGNAFRTISYMQVSCKLTLLETDMLLLPVDDDFFKHLSPAPWGDYTNTILDGDRRDAGSGRGLLMGELLQRLERHRKRRGGHGM